MKKMLIPAMMALFLVPTTVLAQPKTDPKSIDLLASKNLADWDFFLNDPNLKKEDVWSFTQEGNLLCKGEPIGYLCTKEKYKDFKLTVQWRWPEGTKPTNSGVLMRIQGEHRPLPCCVEAQLHHSDAGDIWAFHGFNLEKYEGSQVKNIENHQLGGKMTGTVKFLDAENKPGEWNTFDILCIDETLIVSVNGNIVNWVKGLDSEPGRVALQSEGGLVEFRNVILTPLR
ncbi:MAG: DUF1080 domain-containing protein [Planctomycetaceae bacterium]|jgi:hypothetical protein|nr:DUF1080 domain-containing protein [Planctomycetaceae bacterium]